ncbi:rod shape-determining protein MreC [Thalassobaculum litoreum]|uniref:Cell shape-determining protein MreC n=1 Tax=Thalassobaculum litoreum DSM 18839 TaxID=1123362 RepID=A0A8G2BGN3_9PROT|nr:rod shape-determining protein MreC [Thalassobaculum litoreum]SDF44359.1 rod shape-determining protein MreC [Thalassobaculum litoreum DSM 18839]
MAKRPGSFSSVAQPVRSLWSRFAFATLIIAAFALMLLGKADVLLVDRTRVVVLDALAPVIEVAARPAEAVTDLMNNVRDLRYLRAENARLAVENDRLDRWQHVARRLEAENRALRALTNFVPPKEIDFVSARVIADGGGAFVRSVMITAGRKDGLALGNAAVSGEGLVGGIVEVGEAYSRVLLITDLNSQIPIVIERTRDPGVLAGDNTRSPRIVYLPQNAQVLPGDRIVTSGHGGVFPPGLAVGMVTTITDGSIRVTPFVDWERLEYVRILKTGSDGVVQPESAHLPPFSVMGPETAPRSGGTKQ